MKTPATLMTMGGAWVQAQSTSNVNQTGKHTNKRSKHGEPPAQPGNDRASTPLDLPGCRTQYSAKAQAAHYKLAIIQKTNYFPASLR